MAIEVGAVVEGEVTDSYFRGIQCLCKGYS